MRFRRNLNSTKVSVVATSPSPSAAIHYQMNQHITANSQYQIIPPVNTVRIKPTSLVATIGSTAPCVWQFFARSAGEVTYESRTFLTSGNSIDIDLRNTRSADFSTADLPVAPDLAAVAWTATVTFGTGTGSASISGTATFSTSGAYTGLQRIATL